jgi:hypothetical protein
MGSFLSLLQEKPLPDIPDTSWAAFLDGIAAFTVLIVLGFTLLTLLAYALWARKKKIHFIYDLFAPYTPLAWIFLCIPAGLVAGGYCFWQYYQVLSVNEGGLLIAAKIAALAIFITGLASYVLILCIPGLTPRKFRYRAAPFFHRAKAPQKKLQV